ncbi:MAG: hypothetical protein OHK0029_01800 [Armatimonadaceae bacterium]
MQFSIERGEIGFRSYNKRVASGFNPETARQRIFRFCWQQTQDTPAAEDLTQETLLIGLRRQEQGNPPQAWMPFLLGVARRLCQRWRERQQRFAEYLWDDAPDAVMPAELRTPPEDDPLLALLQREREELVEKALAHIKPGMQALLVARYVQDLPLSEIAAQWKLTENAATVRVHRSREALRRSLETDLRELAAAHGILPGDAADGWRETPIYCCLCGTNRLIGRFVISEGSTTPEFALRCARCEVTLAGQTSTPVTMASQDVLEGVKGFRAGLNRVNRWWQEYLKSALDRGRTACPACGRSAEVRLESLVQKNAPVGLHVVCAHCVRTTFYIAPAGFRYHSDELHEFWRRYPRMRHTIQRPTVFGGRSAVHVVFADTASSARLEAFYDTETMRCLHTEVSHTAA